MPRHLIHTLRKKRVKWDNQKGIWENTGVDLQTQEGKGRRSGDVGEKKRKIGSPKGLDRTSIPNGGTKVFWSKRETGREIYIDENLVAGNLRQMVGGCCWGGFRSTSPGPSCKYQGSATGANNLERGLKRCDFRKKRKTLQDVGKETQQKE